MYCHSATCIMIIVGHALTKKIQSRGAAAYIKHAFLAEKKNIIDSYVSLNAWFVSPWRNFCAAYYSNHLLIDYRNLKLHYFYVNSYFFIKFYIFQF